MDSGTTEIVFPNLKSLDATYIGPDVASNVDGQRWDGHPWKLHLPKLDVLIISCAHDTCPLLKHAVLPPRMDWIYINATAAVLQHISTIPLPTARHIEICSNFRTSGGPDGLVTANRILDGASGSKEVCLGVYYLSYPFVPESITCMLLTELNIMAITSVDTMLGLFRKLPNLIKAVLYSLKLDDIQEDISVPEPGDGCLVEPFDTRIKGLKIFIQHSKQHQDVVVPLTKYLLLRIPTLSWFESRSTPREPIAEFVDAYSAQYPHLAGVKLVLWR